MIILVNGLLPYASGKTTFARALAAEMASRGLAPGVFKPHSAHNFWDMFSHSLRCQEIGKLVSRDALLLAEAAGSAVPIEVVNPHHQLLCPRDPLALVEGKIGGPATADELLAERVSRPEGPSSTLYVHREARSFLAPAEFLAALARGATTVVEFSPSPVAPGPGSADEAVGECYRALRAAHPHLLVESLNDLALPSPIPESDVDAVVTAAANLVLVYRPADFFRAGQALRVRRVQDYLRYASPVLGYRLPFLADADRRDLDRLTRALGSVAAAAVDFTLGAGKRI